MALLGPSASPLSVAPTGGLSVSGGLTVAGDAAFANLSCTGWLSGNGALLTGIASGGGGGDLSGISVDAANGQSVCTSQNGLSAPKLQVGNVAPFYAANINKLGQAVGILNTANAVNTVVSAATGAGSWPLLQGNWVATASSFDSSGGYYVTGAFNGAPFPWCSNGGYPASTGGAYTGTVVTVAGGVSYPGEWVQIQCPHPIQLVTWDSNLYSVPGYTHTTSQAIPDEVYWLGSNDGSTWSLIAHNLNSSLVTLPNATYSFPLPGGVYPPEYSYHRWVVPNTTLVGGLNTTGCMLSGINVRPRVKYDLDVQVPTRLQSRFQLGQAGSSMYSGIQTGSSLLQGNYQSGLYWANTVSNVSIWFSPPFPAAPFVFATVNQGTNTSLQPGVIAGAVSNLSTLGFTFQAVAINNSFVRVGTATAPTVHWVAIL